MLKVGQNIKYDMLVFARHGIAVAPVDDTMLLSATCWRAGSHGHGMDELAELHLGHETIKFKDVPGSGKSPGDLRPGALDKALDYAAEDAEVTWRLHRALKPRLVGRAPGDGLRDPGAAHWCRCWHEMELTGIKVDRGALRRLSNDFARAHRRPGRGDPRPGRARSSPSARPSSWARVLFDEMGLEGGKKTKTGAYARPAPTCWRPGGPGPRAAGPGARLAPAHQAQEHLHRRPAVEQINPETGRVHTSYARPVASTGRLSSNDPNLQNIPVRTEEGRKIRRAFVAERA